METKIFVIGFPVMGEITISFNDAEDVNCCKQKKWCSTTTTESKFVDDLLPNHIKVDKSHNDVMPWGIGGKQADENLRFGYGLEVDEPRYQEFDNDYEFLKARQAFDDFVDAGERCRELGLEKDNDIPITKCQAIRKPIGCPPPMNMELLGESQFPWWEMDIDWDF